VDLKSVKLGLKLHRSRFGGRLINVRPTRTEAELLGIVAKRNEGLQAQGLDGLYNGGGWGQVQIHKM